MNDKTNQQPAVSDEIAYRKAKMKCRGCENEVSNIDKICSNCGKDITDPKNKMILVICHHCETEIKSKEKACSGGGRRVQADKSRKFSWQDFFLDL